MYPPEFLHLKNLDHQYTYNVGMLSGSATIRHYHVFIPTVHFIVLVLRKGEHSDGTLRHIRTCRFVCVFPSCMCVCVFVLRTSKKFSWLKHLWSWNDIIYASCYMYNVYSTCIYMYWGMYVHVHQPEWLYECQIVHGLVKMKNIYILYIYMYNIIILCLVTFANFFYQVHTRILT